MADKLPRPIDQDYDTSQVDVEGMAAAIERNKLVAANHRRLHERRWYDNNFFDDGYHFRYLSRTTNKIIDLSERATVYAPQRAIPKASRQIRGIANLLLSSDPTPTVYPEDYPQTGNEQTDQIAKKKASDDAKKRGWWLEEEWNETDASGETILEKLALMPILTAKHSISWIQIWCDEQEKIRSQVYDAFDLYVIGSYTNIEDLPFIIKATPLLVAQVRANESFDKTQRDKVLADNKPADSMIKQAYLRARYGRDTSSDQAGTAMLYEAFIKEYLNEKNIERIKLQKDAAVILKGREIGDPIIRQTFTANGVWLRDSYLNMSSYPFVDFRMEPGPLYSVPLIERFKDANKSLDSAVSRMERYFHTMVTGMWLKRQGEQFKINNSSGGQIIEYEATPPTQANLANPGQWTFEFMNLLTNFIEEQGVSTTLGQLPTGVKAHAAIESLKEQEYSNLVIAHRRLKSTVSRIAAKMFEIADENYVHPKDVTHSERGKPVNFQVIGATALKKRKNMKIDNPDGLITLSKDAKVDIEVQNGAAYTRAGKQEATQNMINTMLQWAQVGALNIEAVKLVIEKYLESFEFGSTAEFMEAIDKGMGMAMTDQQITQIKTAVLQALQDAGEVGQEASDKRVMENKIGTLQALKDSGLAKGIQDGVQTKENIDIDIDYKDAPEDVKREMEAKAGFAPSKTISPSGSDQIAKHAAMGQKQQELVQAQADSAQQAQQQQAELEQEAELAKQAQNNIPQGGQQ